MADFYLDRSRLRTVQVVKTPTFGCGMACAADFVLIQNLSRFLKWKMRSGVNPCLFLSAPNRRQRRERMRHAPSRCGGTSSGAASTGRTTGHPNCVSIGAKNSSNSLGLSIRSKLWSDRRTGTTHCLSQRSDQVWIGAPSAAEDDARKIGPSSKGAAGRSLDALESA